MTVIRTTTSMIAREISRPTMFTINTVRCLFRMPSPVARSFPDGFVHRLSVSRGISYSAVQCAATSKGAADGGKKASARLSQVQEFLNAATERAQAAGDEPIPKINLDHVSVSFARSGGPGGQNVNKVNTKVDMRFNVKNADWLSERIRDKIIQMEKNRINKDGELVISSTKTRTQKGNIEDALAKLQVFMRQIKTFQEIIDAAAYVPPPPSEETVKKIKKLAVIGEQKRLDKKKAHSQKKALRRSRDSWD